jgi:hypothetical protein
MNMAFALAGIAAVLVVGIVLTYPDIAAGPMLVVGLVVAILGPVAFYPISYTLWAAVDLTMRPLEPDEVADAEAHRPDS